MHGETNAQNISRRHGRRAIIAAGFSALMLVIWCSGVTGQLVPPVASPTPDYLLVLTRPDASRCCELVRHEESDRSWLLTQAEADLPAGDGESVVLLSIKWSERAWTRWWMRVGTEYVVVARFAQKYRDSEPFACGNMSTTCMARIIRQVDPELPSSYREAFDRLLGEVTPSNGHFYHKEFQVLVVIGSVLHMATVPAFIVFVIVAIRSWRRSRVWRNGEDG